MQRGEPHGVLLFCSLLVMAWPVVARAEAPTTRQTALPPASTSVTPSPTPVEPPVTARRGDSPPGQTPERLPNAARLDAARENYHFQPGVTCPFCDVSTDFPNGRSGLHWHDHWRAVGVPEYVLTPALLATSLALQLLPAAHSASCDSPILFDSAARKLLRLHGASARKTAQNVSDIAGAASGPPHGSRPLVSVIECAGVVEFPGVLSRPRRPLQLRRVPCAGG